MNKKPKQKRKIKFKQDAWAVWIRFRSSNRKDSNQPELDYAGDTTFAVFMYKDAAEEHAREARKTDYNFLVQVLPVVVTAKKRST